MRIGLLGTGNLAVALGAAWAGAGHPVVITGRDAGRAVEAAARAGARAVAPGDLADAADVLVVAVAWAGLDQALALVGGPAGALAGKTVVDCTNAVDHATGRLLPETGSAAERVARLAPGSRVVKALHLFSAATWPYRGEPADAPVVAVCGDDAGALAEVETLVAGLGGRTLAVGGLADARQSEGVAGFVMRLAACGVNPRLAVPDVGGRRAAVS